MEQRETEILVVDTPEGPGRAFVDHASDPRATLVLGHGAGGGVTARDLEVLARRLPARGTTVVRFEQPWRTAGGRVAVRPPRLDVAWRALLPVLLAASWCTGPVLVGGRSAGARVACRTAPDFPVAAVVCLAFPLHLPGRPERSRADELAAPAVPRLVFQGTRDAFGTADQVRAAVPVDQRELVTVVDLPGADHSFKVAAAARPTAAELLGTVVGLTAALVDGLVEA